MNDFVIKNSPEKGRGLFSLRDFHKDQIILRFEGKALKLEDMDLTDPIVNSHFQIGTNLYLDLRGQSSIFINHSCNPNSYIKVNVNTAFLVVAHPIKKNEELTFDYSTTSTDTTEMWSMECKCSVFGCRKLITGFWSLSEKQQRDCIEKGFVPKYVREYYKI
jgi:uncharacterized protein